MASVFGPPTHGWKTHEHPALPPDSTRERPGDHPRRNRTVRAPGGNEAPPSERQAIARMTGKLLPPLLARFQPHGNVDLAALANHTEADLVSRPLALDAGEEIIDVLGRLAVDREDQVGG